MSQDNMKLKVRQYTANFFDQVVPETKTAYVCTSVDARERAHNTYPTNVRRRIDATK